jgi:hypothetical protein
MLCGEMGKRGVLFHSCAWFRELCDRDFLKEPIGQLLTMRRPLFFETEEAPVQADRMYAPLRACR